MKGSLHAASTNDKRGSAGRQEYYCKTTLNGPAGSGNSTDATRSPSSNDHLNPPGMEQDIVPTQIFDPATYDPVTRMRQPFPGKVIPRNRLDPVGVTLASLYPAPNQAAAINNFLWNPRELQDTEKSDLRIDYNRRRAEPAGSARGEIARRRALPASLRRQRAMGTAGRQIAGRT